MAFARASSFLTRCYDTCEAKSPAEPALVEEGSQRREQQKPGMKANCRAQGPARLNELASRELPQTRPVQGGCDGRAKR
jgi:hypothetical protein